MNDRFSEELFLTNETGKMLYHKYAEHMPIIDYHCHLQPVEIAENKEFEDLGEMWLRGDHYKWRCMRTFGIDEKYITGDASYYEKYMKFAEILPQLVGNPIYIWCALELKRYFDIDEPLTAANAQEIYDRTKKLITEKHMTRRWCMEHSNVRLVSTTEDPIDDLRYHKVLNEEKMFTRVITAFRPDKAININKPGFAEYMGKLAAVVGKEKLACIDCVTDALTKRIEFFAEMGCRASDHGLDYIPYREASKDEVNAIYQKVMAGETCTTEEAEKYQTYILIHLGKQYHRLNIAMQIHYNCLRNVNRRQYAKFGPDTGFDMINTASCGGEIAALLSALDETNECPKTIIYSLNPADNEQIGTILGCFQSTEVPGKIQHGSAWWFNDQKIGMENQIKSLANLGLLGNFVGMLTDSRSFLSYTRHDYFRRILCNVIGQWVEDGEYPDDEKALEKIVKGICFDNAKRYFAL